MAMNLDGWVIASDGRARYLGKPVDVTDDDGPLILDQALELHGGGLMLQGSQFTVQPMIALPVCGLLCGAKLYVDAVTVIRVNECDQADRDMLGDLVTNAKAMAQQMRGARSGLVTPGPGKSPLSLIPGGK